jgi:hypothetical protein
MISVIRPAPMVRPPSRMAKRWVFSIAMGEHQLDFDVRVVSGHDHLDALGRLRIPVTSVVRK